MRDFLSPDPMPPLSPRTRRRHYAYTALLCLLAIGFGWLVAAVWAHAPRIAR